MARRTAPTEETEAARPSEVRESISKRKLHELLKHSRGAKQDMAEISGTLGKAIASAVEDNHLNRKAFNIVRGLDRLEPEKLADTLDCLDHYLDIGGLRERASAPRMQMGEGDDGEGEGDNGKVAPFPAPRSVAAE